MKMSEATDAPKDLDVPFGAAVLHVTYKPVDYTPREMEAAQESQDIKRVVDMIARTVVKWDLEDEDGNVIPLEQEALMDVRLNIFHGIFAAIAKDGAPDPQA